MLAAANEPDVTIPDMATINTDTGMVRDAANLPVQITSLLVPQAGASDIRVFIGKSLTLSSVTVSGSRPVAFVARDDIRIEGLLDVSATPGRPGAGQQATGPCVGEGVARGGGGGNATAGGVSEVDAPQNGPGIIAGGAALSGTALVGGCGGGGNLSGHGGGAVQLDSLTRITVAASGRIGVGGAGGYDGGGGGSAGFVIIEAPQVELLGGIFANGGAGGACTLVGQDGPLSSSPATAPSCGTGNLARNGGNGGSSSAGPGWGHAKFDNPVGGGGAAGRLLVTTIGDYTTSPGTIISAAITTAALVPR